MIAKKNASIDLQLERQLHVQNGFLVVSALVCAAFAWRSPLVQKLVEAPVVAMYQDVEIIEKTPEKLPDPEPQPTTSTGAMLNLAPEVTEESEAVKNSGKIDATIVIGTTVLPTTEGGTINTDPIIGITPVDIIDNDKIEIADIDAEPLIGFYGLKKYVSENVVYPEIALEAGDEGKVLVDFVVEKNGKISGIKIVRGVSELLDNEALRIVRSFGDWKPGESNGKTVRSRFRYTITFELRK
jgi:periplasmic protein TonB